ncbi:MAG: hypothetical protein C0446_13610 [Chitinophaga sp.]|nr:hypothetical protein [Chitinophaga sp.]
MLSRILILLILIIDQEKNGGGMGITCLLIGEDSLLIQCGRVLLDKGYQIKWVISPIKSIRYWCEENNIAWLSSLNELSIIEENCVDYLFSIVNSILLTKEQLNLARFGAINYHDSLLPRYAGVNATTWALINNEKVHGITWHYITSEVDAGDIVYQKTVPVLDKDTALTLNLRCFEEAINGFEHFINELGSETLKRKKQDIRNRSYYGINHVLPNFGLIDWNTATSYDIERLHRALTFGHYHNNVGVLKLYLGFSIVVVLNVTLCGDKETGKKSGFILAIKSDGILVSTQNGSVMLNRFCTLYGEPIAIDDLVKDYELHVGYLLPCFNAYLIQEYHSVYKRCLKEEGYWLKQLIQTEEHTLFSSQVKNTQNIHKLWERYSLQFHSKEHLLACLLIYLCRLNDYEPFTIFFSEDEFNESSLCGEIFSTWLPFTYGLPSEITPKQIMQELAYRMREVRAHETYLTDIFMRHPELELKQINSIITISFYQKKHHIPPNSIIHFEINERNELMVYHRINTDRQNGALSSILSNMSDHLEGIFQWICSHPDYPINQFCFLTAKEYAQLREWEIGERQKLPANSITELFEHQVVSKPNHIAIYENNHKISYKHLWEKSEKIALFISTLNLSSQTPIGIYLPRSHNMLALILGILKSDCVYVPIDLRYPSLKIEMIIKEAKLTHIMTTENQIAELTSQFGKERLHLYDAEQLLACNTQLAIQSATIKKQENNSLAYIMFTSGTTGTPKGVMVSQKNVINYCHWFSQTNDFTEHSIIDFSSSLAFDLSIPCTLAPLLAGGALAICDEQQKINPQLYLQHLQRYAITHTELTPGYLELLLHYPEDIKQLRDLRYVLLGADMVHTEEVRQWLSLCPESTIVNEYGPTEATVSVTSYRVTKLQDLTEASVPIGRPAFNSSCYLLDKYFNLCPIGMRGELYVGGHQVAAGYFGKPHLTDQKFIQIKLNGRNDRLYRTGDLACWLPKGYLQFFGRNDHQVKIQGYRVELPAIESILMKHDAILQAVVVIREEKHKEKYLRAYLVSDDKNMTTHQLKNFLSLYFPAYMHPKEFCLVPSIPLKENEKIDFDTLEKQACMLLAFNSDIPHQELSWIEQICLNIWQKAFLIQIIHLEDDFFELGGNSLLALQIISSLKHHFKQPIPLSILFENPNIISLASALDRLVTGQNNSLSRPHSSLVKLSSGAYKTPLFLVHPVGGAVFWYQQLAQQLEGKYTVYGIEDQSINGYPCRFTSIAEMARFYLQEIEHVYQGEEYCLGGASFGATVAVEMANQLIQSNKVVKFLGLFDGWAKYPDAILKSNSVQLLTQHHQGIELQTAEQLQELEEYRKQLLLEFKLPIIHTDLTLYKAKELWEPFKSVDDPFNGWQPYIGKIITVHLVFGTHETMFFENNVVHLARLVNIS